MKLTRTIIALGLSALTLAWTGCVTSVYPFYFEKDVAFDPALLGDWIENQNNANVHWKFERDGQTAYRLTHTGERGESSVAQAHLFKLHGQRFLDFLGSEPKEDDGFVPAIPAHLLLRVVHIGPTLELVGLDYDWLGKLLEKNPKAIRHHIIEDHGDNRLVLTADTAELQRFVVKHLKTEAAWTWTEACTLRRAAAPAPAPAR